MFRRLHNGRHHVQVGGGRPGADRQGAQPAQVLHREVLQQLLQREDEHGYVRGRAENGRKVGATFARASHETSYWKA